MVHILKTSAQAKWEERLKQKDARCPECHELNYFSVKATESVGFFGFKTRTRNEYHCSCGCQWATDWE